MSERFASGGIVSLSRHLFMPVGREQVLTPEVRIECRTIWQTSDVSGVEQAEGVARNRAETDQPD